MEVSSESFHRSSSESRTCYPRRAFNQGLIDDRLIPNKRWNERELKENELLKEERYAIDDLSARHEGQAKTLNG